MTTNNTKWPQNIPNVHKICVPSLTIKRPYKIDSILDFWFENKPSGNPEHNEPRAYSQPS
jgi:hypothetical protein